MDRGYCENKRGKGNKIIMEAKDIKWCPQHGYPLPCNKCRMPLSRQDQKEIYQAGIRKVVEWIDEHSRMTYERGEGEVAFNHVQWHTQLKEWGIK